jgi:hypothetical protein
VNLTRNPVRFLWRNDGRVRLLFLRFGRLLTLLRSDD